MIFCSECFRDVELKAAIEVLGKRGTCQVCGKKNALVYDSVEDKDKTTIQEMMDSILEIYSSETELPENCPQSDTEEIEEKIADDWNLFNCTPTQSKQIIEAIVAESFRSRKSILTGKVWIPKMYDESYMEENTIMGKYSWEYFKRVLRDENRFHNRFINLNVLANILRETEIEISEKGKFYRARVSDEKGYPKKEMWAPPAGMASAGRANSKGQRCLYLCSDRDTTVKEIRARAFDYVTVATFQLKRKIKVLDLTSIVHNSPFYKETDKVSFLANDGTLRRIQEDLAKPMSRLDSELDYLPTQYISDFSRALGYDGIKYYSTFNHKAYNIAVFNSNACECTYRKVYKIGNLDYEMIPVKAGRVYS